MSDTEAMVRLMENGAELLRLQINNIKARNYNEIPRQTVEASLAAMAYSRAVLQMVAASVSPEGRTRVNELTQQLLADYSNWADENNGVTMTDGELTSVARFLSSTLDGSS